MRPQYPQYEVVFLECRPGLLCVENKMVRRADSDAFAADGWPTTWQQVLTRSHLGRDPLQENTAQNWYRGDI